MVSSRDSRGRKYPLTIEGKALTLIPSLVTGEEELEVVIWILNRSNFVIFVDEVARGSINEDALEEVI